MNPATSGIESAINCQSQSAYGEENEESLAVRDLLDGLDSDDLTICVSFLQQSVGETSSMGCNLPETLNRLELRVRLPEAARKRFVQILSRLIRAQEGLSRLEIAFIRQIWHEARGDWEQHVGAPINNSVH